jgi:hypothetical protein
VDEALLVQLNKALGAVRVGPTITAPLAASGPGLRVACWLVAAWIETTVGTGAARLKLCAGREATRLATTDAATKGVDFTGISGCWLRRCRDKHSATGDSSHAPRQ